MICPNGGSHAAAAGIYKNFYAIFINCNLINKFRIFVIAFGQTKSKRVDLCSLLLWVEFSKDRPFNDLRYDVDCSKLQSLGWEQRTSFADGLQITVEWYRQFGDKWWGDISHCLTAFPELKSPNHPVKSESHHDLNSVF